MALFGVGEAADDYAMQAVAAARSMLESLPSINHQLALKGLAPLNMGIGIHTGTAVVGSIGSSRRLEYTAIGHTVNIASRVESLTKEVGESLLITASTQQKIASTLATEALPPQYIKGQDQPIRIFRLVSS